MLTKNSQDSVRVGTAVTDRSGGRTTTRKPTSYPRRTRNRKSIYEEKFFEDALAVPPNPTVKRSGIVQTKLRTTTGLSQWKSRIPGVPTHCWTGAHRIIEPAGNCRVVAGSVGYVPDAVFHCNVLVVQRL